MGVYTDDLIHIKHLRSGILDALDTLKLECATFVREVDEETLLEVQKFEVILGLNSVSLIELAYRLELYDRLAVHDQVRPDVADV